MAMKLTKRFKVAKINNQVNRTYLVFKVQLPLKMKGENAQTTFSSIKIFKNVKESITLIIDQNIFAYLYLMFFCMNLNLKFHNIYIFYSY